MAKSVEQIAEGIALRVGHIYFRPLFFGGTSGEVGLSLDLYHSFWAELLGKEKALSEAVRAIAKEQDLGSGNFTQRYRYDHPDSSEQEQAEYVVAQWRKISKLVGLPVPYAKIRNDFAGHERLSSLFPDEGDIEQ